ncbi:hypothetical protein LMH87_001535 [Akanthomyces muscarius]|uniref:Uncharacterized protein n=1 Tax=Akanthomyces muscarius TaxID=2231603 RepID=A0A9W8Q5B0_AKAMU|nr:hypothetical protein LMH87_001535 [Akanthomyces muscarius]KAJ4146982.1 hypothetical protein LMH87_001535 [Akanthomyces muscarius]
MASLNFKPGRAWRRGSGDQVRVHSAIWHISVQHISFPGDNYLRMSPWEVEYPLKRLYNLIILVRLIEVRHMAIVLDNH